MMKRVLCVRLPDWPRQRHLVVPQELELSDREALERAAAWCDAFSPLVGVDTWEPPESLFLDVTGLADLFHGEEMLVEHVAREFGRRGLTVHLALTDTIGAAWALAHYGAVLAGSPDHASVLAWSPDHASHRDRRSPRGAILGDLRSRAVERSGDLSTTDGRLSLRERTSFRGAKGDFEASSRHPLLVPAGQTTAALLPLPVEALRLSADCVITLKELGLRQIGQLLSFPRDSLAARFGPELLLRLDQATGIAAETIATCHPAPLVEAEALFEYPTARQEMIEQALQRQLEQLARQLSPRRQGVQELVCRLRGETGRASEMTIGLYRPSASPQHLAELIAMQWEAAHRKLAEPLAALRLSVTAAAPVEYRQQELFEGLARSCDPRQTALLIDRLSSRLGRSSVVRAKLLAEAQPELAWRYEALVGGKQTKPPSAGQTKLRTAAHRLRQGDKGTRRQGASAAARRWPLSRPLSLMVRPQPVEVVSVAPHGPPQTFSLSGEQHRVERVWGPERIHTGWWRGRSVRRDYYRVETTTGRWFWLFRQLTDRRWYFHGAFD